MVNEFISVLRNPDRVLGATDESPFRFEERENECESPVKYEYIVGEKSAKVIVYPSGSPVKYLKLRFRGDHYFVEKALGDHWERSCHTSQIPFEWKSMTPRRVMPWYTCLYGAGRCAFYGVKTGPDCLALWMADSKGVTLVLSLLNGNRGTDLKEPLLACEVVEYFSEEGEDSYLAARKFAKMMCDNPVMPKTPVFGVNNWYWAYGRISRDTIKTETSQLMEMTSGTKHKPYMILDDGWQLNRSFVPGATYNGGPWYGNDKFGDMRDTAEDILKAGAKAGIWYRPLYTIGDIPTDEVFFKESCKIVLDPSHPHVLERIYNDTKRICDWGFDLIKHDFTLNDLTGLNSTYQLFYNGELGGGRVFHDNTRTTATIIKDLYKTIQNAAGDAEVIGCNTLSHLTAGIHSIYRAGGDGSGRYWQLHLDNCINCMMRLPQNENFYMLDPDCATFTERVNADINLDFLEMCALTGVTTLASVKPGILNEKQMARINDIYRLADTNREFYGISDFDRVSMPEKFVSPDGKNVKEFDWMKEYDGARYVMSWEN